MADYIHTHPYADGARVSVGSSSGGYDGTGATTTGSREDGVAMLIDTQADIDVLRSDLKLPPSPARVRRMHAASAEFSQGSMGAGGCVYN